MNDELDAYFSGQMPEDEKKDFFQKLQEDPEKRLDFARMKNTEALTGLMSRGEDSEKTLKGWFDLNARLSRRSAKQVRNLLLRYAAVACLLLVGTWFLSREYTLSTRETLFTEIQVPKGQRVNLTLADGTSVWLSPRTKIRIPNEFDRTHREVELDGEGYFEVTKDKKRPFIVKTGLFNIEVLGTKFNVFSYSERSRFETCLVEGSVCVYNRDRVEERIQLEPNEKVSWVDNRMVKSSSDFNNENYLRSGIFSFHAKPFGEILDYLSLWYDVKFKITGSLALSRTLSGKFRQSEEVENILIALQGVHHFNFRKITENQFEIY